VSAAREGMGSATNGEAAAIVRDILEILILAHDDPRVAAADWGDTVGRLFQRIQSYWRSHGLENEARWLEWRTPPKKKVSERQCLARASNDQVGERLLKRTLHPQHPLYVRLELVQDAIVVDSGLYIPDKIIPNQGKGLPWRQVFDPAGVRGAIETFRIHAEPYRSKGFEIEADGDEPRIALVRQQKGSEVERADPDSLLMELGDAIRQLARFTDAAKGPVFEHLYRALAPEFKTVEPSTPPETASAAATSEDVRRLAAHLNANPCVVLQGPPGTGKTRLARKLVEHFAAKEGLSPEQCLLLEGLSEEALRTRPIVWDIVQLHPGYTYEDFVRGLRTKPNAPGIEFVPHDGVLLRIAAAASKRAGKPTLLVLDEINRCNLASVLGELIVLLEKDKREGAAGCLSVRLQYPGDPDRLTLPPNLWIVGTMNTADRSIALVDYAIRRRFRFVDVLPDATVPRQPRAQALMRAINQAIREPRLQIGHSYFLVDEGEADWTGALADRVVWEVLPLLREYRMENLIQGTEIAIGGERRLPLTLEGYDPEIVRATVLAFLEQPA